MDEKSCEAKVMRKRSTQKTPVREGSPQAGRLPWDKICGR
jgi:hypothetical protein